MESVSENLVDELLQGFVDRYRPVNADEMADEIISPVDIATEVQTYASCTPQQVVVFLKESGWKLELQHDNHFAYNLMRRTVK